MLEYLWWITSIALVSGPFVIAFHPDNRLANSEINITLLILLIIASLVLIVLYTYSIWLVYCFSSHYDMIMNPIDLKVLIPAHLINKELYNTPSSSELDTTDLDNPNYQPKFL